MINSITLYTILISMNFTTNQAMQMDCIAFHESSYHTKAIHHNRNGTNDYGLFQINDVQIKTCHTDKNKLLTLKENIRCATQLYIQKGPKVWSTHKKCPIQPDMDFTPKYYNF